MPELLPPPAAWILAGASYRISDDETVIHNVAKVIQNDAIRRKDIRPLRGSRDSEEMTARA